MDFPRLPILIPLAAAAALALPAAASAKEKIICVNAPNCPADGTAVDAKGSLASALSSAKTLPEQDTILVGANGGTPYVGKFSYDTAGDPTNTVQIKADGPGRPQITAPVGSFGSILTLASANLKGIDVRIPDADMTALTFADGVLDDVAVTGGGTKANSGIETSGAVRLDRTTVDVHADTGIISSGVLVGDRVTVRGAIITGFREGADATRTSLRRSRIEAVDQSLSTASGGLVVASSALVTTGPFARTALLASDAFTLDHVTIADRGSSALPTTAIRFRPTTAVTASLQSVVIAGFRTGILRDATAGGTPTVSIKDSVWDPSGDQGSGPFIEKNNAHADPKLVNRAAGDLRLRASSPAIDRDLSTPAQPPYTDIDALGAIDGDGDGTARPDAGALEYRRQAPTVDATVPSTASPGAPIGVSASASDPDGDAASVAWDFGDGTGASGATASHAYTAPGTFTVTVTATDETGLKATKAFAVVVQAPPTPGGGQPGGGAQPGGGGGVGQPGGGGGQPAGDRTAPRLRAAKLSVTKVSARKAAKKKLALALDVSEAASLRVTVVRGKTAPKAIVRTVPAGRSKVALAAALKKVGALKKGAVKLTVVATDKAGNRSAPKTLKLTLAK